MTQTSLFNQQPIVKKSKDDEYIINKHAECMNRWVLAREMQRKLKKSNLPFEWMDKYLDKTHYSITEETFNLIKDRYEKNDHIIQKRP